MTITSAPVVVYLIGEHGVVYGEPTVLCAIDLQARGRTGFRCLGCRHGA